MCNRKNRQVIWSRYLEIDVLEAGKAYRLAVLHCQMNLFREMEDTLVTSKGVFFYKRIEAELCRGSFLVHKRNEKRELSAVERRRRIGQK